MKTAALFVACVAFAHCPIATHAASNIYVETFNTTTYKNAANTTAFWDTGTGELKVPPFVPSIVGNYDSPGTAYSVALAGDIAYVADHSSGLHVVDITDTNNPVLITTYDTPGLALDVAVSGDLAFVADQNSGLLILNIANPASPSLIGSYNTPGVARGVVVEGDLAFVADLASGLQIINVANPASPTPIGNYNTPGSAIDVCVEGDLAFVPDADQGIQIINISNPASPSLVGAYNSPGNSYDVCVSGDLAFMTDDGNGLLILDIANPASPSLVGTYNTPGNAWGVAVSGDLAFVADAGSGLHILDITNPSSPTLVATVNTPGTAFRVVVAGEHAFVGDYVGGVQVIEVMTLTLNSLVGSYNTTGNAYGVAVAGDLAFVADEASGLQIINIANPTSPTLVGSYNTPGNSYGVAVAGDLAFIADEASGLQIVNVANPTSPTLVGSYNTPGNAYDIVVAGDLAFVADGASGLQIINIANPANPTLAGGYNTPGNAFGIVVAGDLAFVADEASGLQIVNIANPASPLLVGNYNIPSNAVKVTVAGDLAFVADVEGGLQIIDITDPTGPMLVGSYATPAAYRVAVAGDLAFVANLGTGLQIIDIANPTSPTLVGSHDTPGLAVGVAVAGDLAFVADHATGLQAIRVLDHQYHRSDDTGQSLPIDASAESIILARLTSTQTAGVTWELSADSGQNWQTITPDNAWNALAVPGDDLVWRSTHTIALAGPNAIVSDLQIEWLYEHAAIRSIADVADDQGGRVYVDLSRSVYDSVSVLVKPVTQYGVYRRVDDAALTAMIQARAASGIEPAHNDPFLPGVETAWVNGAQYVLGSTPVAAANFPPGIWALVATVPATQQDGYLVEVTTAADSSEAGTNASTFVVTSHTTTPSVWFISPTESGYSVDNIAPAVPANFAVVYNTGSGNTLSWNPSPDDDFQYFRVYRSDDPGFTPSPGTLVHATTSTNWADPAFDGWTVHYKVTALDYAGNESDAAVAGSVTAIDDAIAPRSFALYPNIPNPFNPMTRIRYDVPEGGGVMSLRIYDVSGRLVKTLVDGVQSAGAKDVSWNGHDDAGRPLASGVYFYRLSAPEYTRTHKMVLLK